MIALEAAVARAEARWKYTGTVMTTGYVGVGSGGGGGRGGLASVSNPFLDQFDSDRCGDFGWYRLGEGGSRRIKED